MERRAALGGSVPRRVVRAEPLPAPAPEVDAEFAAAARPSRLDDDGLRAAAAQPASATRSSAGASCRSSPTRRARSAWTRCSRRSASTPPTGSTTTPVDSELVLSYREAIDGQVLEEGINEAGSMASLQAAGHGLRHARRADDPVLHVLLDVRVPADRRPGVGLRRPARARVHDRGDGRADDARGRGPAARRRPHAGAGLHGAGRSGPTTRRSRTSWPPSSATASRACTRDGEDVFYYVTVYNENYPQPAKPEGVDEGIVRGLYRFAAAPEIADVKGRVRLVGSGSIMQQVLAARDLLAERFGIAAEVYSATSFQQLRHEALQAERWNRLNPDKAPRVPYVAQVLGPDGGPIVVATDWIKTLPDLVAPWVAAAVHRAGHGRLRAERHARGAAGALRDRRRRTSPAAALSGLVRRGELRPGGGGRGDPRAGPGPGRPGRADGLRRQPRPPDRPTAEDPMRRRPRWLEVLAVSLRLG